MKRSPIRLLHPHPALLLTEEGKKHLVVTDLHIGFEGSFASSGIRIESSISSMLEELTGLIQLHKPDRLVILGDVKHSVETISHYEWRDVPRFFEKIQNHTSTTIVKGNHDGGIESLLPRGIRLAGSKGLLIGGTALLHGHTTPSGRLSKARRLLMGHLHPTYSRQGSPLSGTQVWLIAKAKKRSLFKGADEDQIDIYVLPSFNRELSYAGFTSFKGRIISPIIRRTLGGITEAAVITLQGDIIGDAESIRFII